MQINKQSWGKRVQAVRYVLTNSRPRPREAPTIKLTGFAMRFAGNSITGRAGFSSFGSASDGSASEEEEEEVCGGVGACSSSGRDGEVGASGTTVVVRCCLHCYCRIWS